jgi:hypothetical protein
MPSFWFEYEQDDGSTQTFDFEGDSIAIGRAQDADFVLDDPTVSRQHAMIVSEPHGGHRLVVLSERGMTAVNGNQVRGDVQLQDGATVHFGKLGFRFRSQTSSRQNFDAGQQSFGGGMQGGGMQGGGMQGGGMQGGGMQGGGMQGGGMQGGGMQGGGMQQGSAPFGGGPSSPGQSQQNQGGGAQGPGPSSGDPFSGGFQGSSGGPSDGGMGFGGGPQGGGPSGPSGGGPSSGGGGESGGGVMSWDEIAASAEAADDYEGSQGAPDDAMSTFQRMEEAQKKRKDESNPLIIVGGLIGIAVVGYFLLFGGDDTGDQPIDNVVNQENMPDVVIDTNCVDKKQCRELAKKSYAVGEELLLKKDVDIANLYNGYKKMLEAEAALKEGNIARIPPEMRDLPKKKKQARKELDAIFRNYRVKYSAKSKHDMYGEMAEALDAIKSYFPDKKAWAHRWALEKERKMRSNGTWPQYR